MRQMTGMKISDTFEHFGGPAATARALGVSPSTVNDWRALGMIPEARQYQIELATGGKLKADLPALRVNQAA